MKLEGLRGWFERRRHAGDIDEPDADLRLLTVQERLEILERARRETPRLQREAAAHLDEARRLLRLSR